MIVCVEGKRENGAINDMDATTGKTVGYRQMKMTKTGNGRVLNSLTLGEAPAEPLFLWSWQRVAVQDANNAFSASKNIH